MENQNTPTPSGTSPGAASAGSGQTALRRFLVQFTMAACEEFEAPTADAALSDAENSDAPPLCDFTGLGSQVVAEWDPFADDWKDTPPAPAPSPAPNLSRVSVDDLAAELWRRERAGECVALVITPDYLAEYWECDDAGNTHPGSRVPEAEEMRAISRAFERWMDRGAGADLMETMRDAWQAEQARQLDAEKEGGSK